MERRGYFLLKLSILKRGNNILTHNKDGTLGKKVGNHCCADDCLKQTHFDLNAIDLWTTHSVSWLLTDAYHNMAPCMIYKQRQQCWQKLYCILCMLFLIYFCISLFCSHLLHLFSIYILSHLSFFSSCFLPKLSIHLAFHTSNTSQINILQVAGTMQTSKFAALHKMENRNNEI